MNLFRKRSREKDPRTETKFEEFLFETFAKSVQSLNEREHQIFFPSKDFNCRERSKILLSILIGLIFLLSRALRKNSVHMYMIMFLIEEINRIQQLNLDKHLEREIKYRIHKVELLLECCYETMVIAEKKANKFSELEIQNFPFFKDEKTLIIDYFTNEKYTTMG
ncbi:hypothetical protein [Streptomyces sp. NPDC014685]|uniref:hypothetical protein n=1 Tax=Streptomyces sp. NPDC014685 TaxID=3364881 RepID=UPI0037037A8A